MQQNLLLLLDSLFFFLHMPSESWVSFLTSLSFVCARVRVCVCLCFPFRFLAEAFVTCHYDLSFGNAFRKGYACRGAGTGRREKKGKNNKLVHHDLLLLIRLRG
jgi:hypothetical protein